MEQPSNSQRGFQEELVRYAVGQGEQSLRSQGVGRVFGVWVCMEFEPLRQEKHLRKETQWSCFGMEVTLAFFLTSEAI